MLLDCINRSLFTGDTFYPDWLFAFIDEAQGGSDLKVYENTMQELTWLIPELDYLYCSHTKPLASPAVLDDVAKAFEIVLNGDDTEYELIEMYGQELKIHHFDGFAIVTKKNNC
jgi:glyoxylase-like metal-dependent hydrolase (beta-lactamase superfamily II)